jgi:phenylalanyl-tRNA synthetase alpha subunit
MTAFVQVMNELRDYHKNKLAGGHAIAPQRRSLSSISTVSEVTPEVARELDALQKMSKELAETQNESMELSIINDAQALSNAGGSQSATEAFKQKMNERREREKTLSAENIDKIFDSAIKIGERHPAAQDAIVSVSELISGLFREMSKLFNDFIIKVVAKVTIWIQTAFEDIKNTFGNISGWIRGWFV